jgi:hypothetical protein
MVVADGVCNPVSYGSVVSKLELITCVVRGSPQTDPVGRK